jgi:hypothetical protein
MYSQHVHITMLYIQQRYITFHTQFACVSLHVEMIIHNDSFP